MNPDGQPPVARFQGATRFLAAFWPAPVRVDARERWRSVAGAGLGILFTALLSRWWAGGSALGPWLVAPLGASAVLVFGVPTSPLAHAVQPVPAARIAALLASAMCPSSLEIQTGVSGVTASIQARSGNSPPQTV